MAQTYKEKNVLVDNKPCDLEIIVDWSYVRGYLARKALRNRSKKTCIGPVTVKVKEKKVA